MFFFKTVLATSQYGLGAPQRLLKCKFCHNFDTDSTVHCIDTTILKPIDTSFWHKRSASIAVKQEVDSI